MDYLVYPDPASYDLVLGKSSTQLGFIRPFFGCFIFVNDLIAPFWVCPWALGWDACYENNKGSANATVRKIAEPPNTSAR